MYMYLKHMFCVLIRITCRDSLTVFSFPARYNLHDDVRLSLYQTCDEWMKAVGKRNYLGGDEPCVADLVRRLVSCMCHSQKKRGTRPEQTAQTLVLKDCILIGSTCLSRNIIRNRHSNLVLYTIQRKQRQINLYIHPSYSLFVFFPMFELLRLQQMVIKKQLKIVSFICHFK